MAKVKIIPGIDPKKFNQLLSDLDKTTAQVGWFESAKYENGTQVAYVAAIQEYGATSPPIPPRLGMRSTIVAQEARWGKLMEQEVRKLLTQDSGHTPQQVMTRMGLQAQGDFKKTISKVTEPPLSIVTLLLRKRKKMDKSGTLRITGKTVGEAHKVSRTEGPVDISGVSTKPLIDTGLLLATLTHVVKTK